MKRENGGAGEKLNDTNGKPRSGKPRSRGRSSGSNVDIEIRFENYYHGDEDAFDGPGGDN